MYPLDKLTAEGRPFWSLPKRAPKVADFDPHNLVHATFISSFACLQANKYGIQIPFNDARSDESRLAIAQLASKFVLPEFVLSEQKAKEIEAAVSKQEL